MKPAPWKTYSYHWFRHRSDGSLFIGCRDELSGAWLICGSDVDYQDVIFRDSEYIGPVPWPHTNEQSSDGAATA